jgi:hypothetical protein
MQTLLAGIADEQVADKSPKVRIKLIIVVRRTPQERIPQFEFCRGIELDLNNIADQVFASVRFEPPDPNGGRCARRRAMAAGFGLDLLSATAFAAHAHRHQRRKTQSAPDAVNSRCRPRAASCERLLPGS